LFKEIVDGRTDARTMDDGQWAITKAHLEHFVTVFLVCNRFKIFFIGKVLFSDSYFSLFFMLVHVTQIFKKIFFFKCLLYRINILTCAISLAVK